MRARKCARPNKTSAHGALSVVALRREKRKTADRPAAREASGHRAAVVARGAPGRGLGLVQLGALGLFFSPARGPHAKTNGDVRGGIKQAATRSRHPQSIEEKAAGRYLMDDDDVCSLLILNRRS